MSEIEKNLELLESLAGKKISAVEVEYKKGGMYDGAITKITIKIKSEFEKNDIALTIDPNSHFNFSFLSFEEVKS